MEDNELYKVSILVPIYGVEKYISECAHSLFRQTYNNIEYIFVDDCTPDNSIKVLESVLDLYPERKASVKIIRHEENKGLSTARNTALDNSSGAYVMHVDSDDYLDENAIETCIASVKNTGSDLVRLSVRQDFGDRKKEINISFIDKTEYLKKLLRRETLVTVWGVLYKKSLLIRNGIRSVDGVSFGEDYCTLPRIVFYSEKIDFISNVHYNYVMFNVKSLTNIYTHKNFVDAQKVIITLENFFFSEGKEHFKTDFQVGALTLKADMLSSSIKGNIKEDWSILRSICCGYNRALIQSIKVRIKLWLIDNNFYSILKLLYR